MARKTYNNDEDEEYDDDRVGYTSKIHFINGDVLTVIARTCEKSDSIIEFQDDNEDVFLTVSLNTMLYCDEEPEVRNLRRQEKYGIIKVSRIKPAEPILSEKSRLEVV